MDEEWARWRSCARRYFSRRLRDRGLVDELAQEACVRVWLARRDGRVGQVDLAWVVGVSSRLFADHQRDVFGARRFECDAPWTWDSIGIVAETREATVPIEGEAYRLSRVLQVLDECVGDLSDSWRFLVEERMHGSQVRDIAKRHGLTVDTVKLRLFRGRKRLRQAMLDRLQKEDGYGD